MLLYLKNVKDGTVFYLTGKDHFLIGRKDCDLIISNDQSISRKHAVLHLKNDKVSLEDCGSKYGTQYKKEKLTPNMEIELAVGDNIQFGVSNSIYSLQKYEFVTTGTRLHSTVKAKLLSDLSEIKGKYVDQWTETCTHLTVEEITLTVKFLHALIDEKPVVKPTYWAKFAEKVQKNLVPPDIDQYNKPPVAEILLNEIDLNPNPNRKTLFKSKQFIFPKEKDKKQLEIIIKKTGGTSISWEKNPIPLEDIKASPKEFLIIQTTESTDDPNLNKMIKEFSKQGKRTIPLQEIATAILLCSCEKDCNPSFNRIQEVFPISVPKEPTQNKALAANTESQYFSVKSCKIEGKEDNLTIPDTFENKLDHIEHGNILEKGKLIPEEQTNYQSVKRLNSDTLQDTPAKKTKVDNGNKSVDVKEERKDDIMPKNITPQKKIGDATISKSKHNENKSDTRTNPFAFLNKNKRNRTETDSSSESNPFKMMKKQSGHVSQVNQENPFKLSLGNKKRGNEDDISALTISKKKKDSPVKNTIFSSTLNTGVSHIHKSLNISKINRNLMNSTWMSKTIMNGTTDIENLKYQFDIEMQQFINQFKNSVVVEVMKKIPSKSKTLATIDNVKYPKAKMNFKIFKKVLPVRPQNTIIGKVGFTAVAPGDTTGITDSRRHFHNSDDEVEETVKSKKKMPKKFLI